MSDIRIPDELRPLCRPLSFIKPNPSNANRHPPSQIDALVASFTEFGVDQPVITNAKGVLIAGHGRLEAARALGMTEYPVVVNDLSSLDATRRMIGDNRLSQLAEPDTEALGELLRQLQAEDTLAGTGYDDGAVDALLAEIAKETTGAIAPEDFSEYGDDIETQYCCPKCGYEWSGKPK